MVNAPLARLITIGDCWVIGYGRRSLGLYHQELFDVFRGYYLKSGIRVCCAKRVGTFAMGLAIIPLELKSMQLTIDLLNIINLVLLTGAPEIGLSKTTSIDILLQTLGDNKILP